MEILQQASILHQLCDDEYRLLRGADSVELDQLGMSQLLHDLRLGQEVLGVHGAWLESLDGDWCCVVPDSLPDLSELSMSQFLNEFQTVSVNLPLITSRVAQVRSDRLLNLKIFGKLNYLRYNRQAEMERENI